MLRFARTLPAGLVLLLLLRVPAFPQASATARSRITGSINEGQLARLEHNTHPLARAEFDRGKAPASLPMERMLLVLTPSSEREQALAELLQAQQDKSSKQYHQWLTPQQFGQRFGAADADIAKITGWLQSHGFSVSGVSNARNLIEFSGTAGQVADAFHTEIHHYVVNGKNHWANASDPKIPAALTPVVAGVASLYSFRKQSQIATVRPNAIKIASGGFRTAADLSGGEHALAPGDFATIYNIAALYTASVNGSGSTIAVVSRTNIHMSDIQSFQSAFGVPANLPQIVVNGTDPGDIGDGDEAEAVLDTSWSSALAPNATVDLVVSADTNTTDGLDLSEEYIVNNNLADVMTESYGDCEANYTQAEAQFYSSLAQQAAAEGITFTVAAGDSGAEGCDDPGSETVATGPVSVNVLAANPYVIGVGGTEFNEGNNSGSYWQGSNGTNYSSAVSYIPEVAWNDSCLASACGGSNAGIWAGGGGASIFYSKPAWQTGVTGIPSDSARDVPDISFTSASHDFYLLCLDGSCTTQHGESSFSGVSGTSAATPSFAAVVALLVQSTGSRQGQIAPTLYALAGSESAASCNASGPAASCIFNDVTAGNNAVPGESGYGTSTAAYQAGVGYDLATGLGSANVYNLITGWNGATPVTPQIRVGIEAPSSQNSSVTGLATFSGWALASSGSVQAVSIAIDSVPYTNATYGASRPDICALYSGSNCPNVGWTFSVDTTLLSSGTHSLDVTVSSSTGGVYTASANFTVVNWAGTDPMHISIDRPNSSNAPFSGTAYFGGWAVDDLAAISQVAISIDGVSYGQAVYGGTRNDVCNAMPGRAGCPNVGWNLAFDTTTLADGPHTLTVTPMTTGGQYSAASSTFTVANTPSNPISLAIDTPSVSNPPYSGLVDFGGWAVTTTVPISSVAVTIDGVSYGNAVYGSNRQDVCRSNPNRPNCPDVGWNVLVDTTQLVNGFHLLGVTAFAGASQRFTSTRLFTAANASPASPVTIGIEAPSPSNAVLLGVNNFSGWAVNVNSAITGVKIAIDGAPYGTASYGLSRPDVCAIYSDAVNCPGVGWSIPVDTTQLADGVHTVTVTALGSPQKTLTAQFTVVNWTTANPMKFSIDNPNSQSGPLSGTVAIGGWVLDQIAPIAKVSIAVDGIPLGNAYYGAARADVCAAAPAPGCPNVGWNFYLDTTLLSDGSHTLSLTGLTTSDQSSTFTGSFQVANGGTTPVHVSIDTPNASSVLTGISAVGGWALDTTGANIASVVVLVDGELLGTASYGGARSDVCAHFPAGGGCPNVGWNYELNTAPFANGTHTMEVRALSTDGKLYTAAQQFSVSNQP